MNRKKLSPAYITRTIEKVEVLQMKIDRLRATIISDFDIDEDDEILELEDLCRREDAGLPVDERKVGVARFLESLDVASAELENLKTRFDNE